MSVKPACFVVSCLALLMGGGDIGLELGADPKFGEDRTTLLVDSCLGFPDDTVLAPSLICCEDGTML